VAANETIVDNEQSVSALSKLNTSCEQPPVHLIDATSTIGRKLIKRRKNKIRACVKNHANQLSYVGKCTRNDYYWPLGRLGAQYHVKPQIKTVGCMSPYHGGNEWSRLLNEQFVVNQLEAFNNPDWHRILVVEHPRIRFVALLLQWLFVLDSMALGIIYFQSPIHKQRITWPRLVSMGMVLVTMRGVLI